MKTPALILSTVLVVAGTFLSSAPAQKAEAPVPRPTPPPDPPPVVIAPAPPTAPPEVYVYEQKPLAGKPVLVQPQQAQTIIDKFKAGYPKLGSPRMVIYVNRELVDEKSGLKLIARTEKIEGSNNDEKSARENRYRLQERKESALADKQTVRDLERLFGRPLRMAGANLTDQRVATQLMADNPPKSLATEGEQARKDREALSKFADVAVEILISSKDVQVVDVTGGDRTYSVPDIQATAIRLNDSKIMGQSASSDVAGKSPYYARNFDVREVAEATALALMEDMLTGVDLAAKP